MNTKIITSGERKKKMQLEIYSKIFLGKQSAFSLPSVNVSAQATIKKLS